MSDLFDITDPSDLPFKTVDERKQEALRLRLIEILPEAEGPVSLTQIRAALFRKYEKNYMPNYIINILCGLMDEGLVNRVDRGVYEWSAGQGCKYLGKLEG